MLEWGLLGSNEQALLDIWANSKRSSWHTVCRSAVRYGATVGLSGVLPDESVGQQMKGTQG